MFLPNPQSFLLVREKKLVRGGKHIFLPNSGSFLLARSVTVNPVRSKTPKASADVQEHRTSNGVESVVQVEIQESATGLPPPSPSDSGHPTIRDKNKRTFLKAAGVAGVSLVASLFLPKKAEAFIMGSSPTTGVVGVKNAANTRINPATQETVSTLLKTSDLTFDAGSVAVKVTSLPPSSFSDSGNVAKSGLVDVDRHVQVDVLSSALPTTASTETTLQTISFGGFKFTLRLDSVGSVDYVGEASIGTLTSAASWRIKKVDSTTGIIIQWAGTGVFNQIWDNRASLTYS